MLISLAHLQSNFLLPCSIRFHVTQLDWREHAVCRFIWRSDKIAPSVNSWFVIPVIPNAWLMHFLNDTEVNKIMYLPERRAVCCNVYDMVTLKAFGLWQNNFDTVCMLKLQINLLTWTLISAWTIASATLTLPFRQRQSVWHLLYTQNIPLHIFISFLIY